MNTRGELELDANRVEPENQAEFAPGPDPDQKIKFPIFFSKNQIRHYACSPRKRTACCVNVCPKKGMLLFTLIVGHPVVYGIQELNEIAPTDTPVQDLRKRAD